MIAAKPDRTQGHSGIRRATGRTYDQWFALLDRWGAPGRPFRETADWLEGEHDLSSWWAQKLIVEYEQTRGLPQPAYGPAAPSPSAPASRSGCPSNASTTPSWILRSANAGCPAP